MKYRFLLLSTLLASGTVLAQNANRNLEKSEIGVQNMHAPLMETSYTIPVERHSDYTSKLHNDGLGVVIFEEDFDAGIPNSWGNASLSNGQEEWEYRGPSTTPDVTVGSRGQWASGTGPIESTTASNGFVIMDSDWWDTGGTAAGSGQQSSANHQAALTSPIIDCSTYPAVILTFESQVRNYQSFFYVIVSTDAFSTADTVWNGEDYYGVNEISPDAELVKLDVSQYLGGSNSAQVRFHYASNTAATLPGYYYWQLDDIALSTPPDFDLALDDIFFNGVGPFLDDYMFNNYYYSIPQRQASADTIVFGGYYSNNGTADMTNATMTVDVSGAMTFSSQVTPETFPSLTSDSGDVEDGFTATAIGAYDVSFTMEADSADDFPDDNTLEESFNVTERLYSRHDDVRSSGVYWGTGNYAIYSRFDVFAVDTISSVDINLYYSTTNTDFQTADGSVVEVGVYAISGYDNDGNPIVDFENPLVDGDGNEALAYYTVASGDPNNTVSVNFDAPVGIPAGVTEVLAGYAYSAGTIRTSTSAVPAGFGNIWVDTQNDGTLEGWTGTTNPMISMTTWSSTLCDNTTIVVDISVDCDLVNSTASLVSAVASTGSSQDFTYAWSNEETTEDIEIDAEGQYSLTVTDGNYCTGSAEINVVNSEVNCNLSVEDIEMLSNGFSVMPNPTSGTFALMFNEGLTETVQIDVLTINGELIHSQKANAATGSVVNLDMTDAAKGIYLVKVTGDKTAAVEQVIIQ